MNKKYLGIFTKYNTMINLRTNRKYLFRNIPGRHLYKK